MPSDFLNETVNWLDQSKLPPVICAVIVMIFALCNIWRDLK
jgi:hypothetical protein